MPRDRFLKQLYDTQCCFKIPEDEVTDIETSVSFVIKSKLKATFESLPACRGFFTIQEIITAGSYFEGTKIEIPNEFDFMIVIRELSYPDVLKVRKGCRPGYVKVKVTERDRWPNPNPDRPPSLEKLFRLALVHVNVYLTDVLHAMKRHRLCEASSGELHFKCIVTEPSNFVQTAVFTWKRRFPKGDFKCSVTKEIIDGVPLCEACKSNCKHQILNEIEISVDLVACCYFPFEELKRIVDFNVDSADLSLIEVNGCHITLKPCGNPKCIEENTQCHIVSYAKSERVKMKKAEQNWKILYKCLKWMFWDFEILGLDSYQLKTTVLCLSENMDGATLSLEDGIFNIIFYLRLCFTRKSIPSYFNRALDLYKVKPHFSLMLDWSLLFMEKLIEGIRQYEDFDFVDTLGIINEGKKLFRENITQLHRLDKNSDKSATTVLRVQKDVFLNIIETLEPQLLCHKQFKFIPSQMKIQVFGDVLKSLK